MTEFIRLYARILTGGAAPEDFRGWAGKMLSSGYDFSSLRTLATMGETSDSVAERERLFMTAVAELRLELPEPLLVFADYAVLVAAEMVERTIQPQFGMSILSGLYRRGNFSDHTLSVWYDLDEACRMLLEQEGCCLFPELNRSNIDGYLIDEARLFLALRDFNYSVDFRRWRFCRQCGFLGVPLQRLVKASFFRRVLDLPDFSMYRPCCPDCGNQRLWSMRTQAARVKMLEKQLRNQAG